ncbi:collagen alpha-1(XXVII) chain-like [Erythrolamprus reginae]|uniref:collagen alpha-1(XXVII) chain-like n=1 Tax=Erythrolamprus reginae TaxID=121349 RepID=UPI00396C852A
MREQPQGGPNPQEGPPPAPQGQQDPAEGRLGSASIACRAVKGAKLVTQLYPSALGGPELRTVLRKPPIPAPQAKTSPGAYRSWAGGREAQLHASGAPRGAVQGGPGNIRLLGATGKDGGVTPARQPQDWGGLPGLVSSGLVGALVGGLPLPTIGGKLSDGPGLTGEGGRGAFPQKQEAALAVPVSPSAGTRRWEQGRSPEPARPPGPPLPPSGQLSPIPAASSQGPGRSFWGSRDAAGVPLGPAPPSDPQATGRLGSLCPSGAPAHSARLMRQGQVAGGKTQSSLKEIWGAESLEKQKEEK